MTRLVVGLGNPGPEYALTRHNVGFRVLDRWADREGLLFRTARDLAAYSGPRAFRWARSEKHDALLVKPETWMNRSGDVVRPLAEFLGLIDPGSCDDRIAEGAFSRSLLVCYDDLDLPPAKLRLRPFGGTGGHNGMRSLVERLGTDRFPRLRVGIGRGRTDVVRWVLEPFTDDEEEQLAVALEEAADAVQRWLETDGDIEACMTHFHPRWSG